ncbi:MULTISPECIES: hypothetical protein [Priestia]|uniref:hypothetical protein n=1 Tax=Priestia TaxID=2800373 RepID=UPI0005ED0F9A|nr:MULTISPECIES: hypothetical protein [Priestia]KJL06183.1 hypothetical protein N178_03290 [Priestia aryabhattai B8W22]MBX4163017.1 hypothetical protein [Priestia megaterium]MED3895474.1 hypothetical protein [Priestia aryabhattai]
MKNLKKIGLGLVASLLSISLVACGSTKEEKKQEEAKQEQKQMGKEKKELEQKISKLESDYEDYTKEKGYMESDDYLVFEADFNILAKSIESKNILQGDDGEIDKHLKDLKTEIDNLSNDQAIKAQKRYGSAVDVYEAAIGTHLHYVLTKADITQHFNAVNTIELDKDFNADNYDYEKIDADATEAIKSIQGTPMKRIKLIKEELEKYKASFSTEEYKQLSSAVNGISLSLNKQVEMLEVLQKQSGKDKSTLEENTKIAETQFLDAKEKVSAFESKLDIQM